MGKKTKSTYRDEMIGCFEDFEAEMPQPEASEEDSQEKPFSDDIVALHGMEEFSISFESSVSGNKEVHIRAKGSNLVVVMGPERRILKLDLS